MTTPNDRLTLSVSIAAEELAALQRRMAYFEAVAVQLLRDTARVKEWFAASELEALRLPGLPETKSGIIRLANAEGWRFREVSGRGGMRREYHFASLPRRAFAALLDRVLNPPDAATHAPPAALPPAAFPPPVPAACAPSRGEALAPWALPLMRIIRANPGTSIEAARAELLQHMPADALPGDDELFAFAARFNLSR